MKEIKQDEFWEFKILPITLWVFAAVCVLVALLRKKIGLYAFTIFYLIFGVAFMYDFWKWEYDYGHNLDPNAAIVVPGMSYQPPLFGSKQLLNFVAHSYPDVGGWILISAGALLLIACFIEFRKPKNKLN